MLKSAIAALSVMSCFLTSPLWAHVPPKRDDAFLGDASTLILAQTRDNYIKVLKDHTFDPVLIPIHSHIEGRDPTIAFSDTLGRYVAKQVLQNEFVVSRAECINKNATVMAEQTKGAFFKGPIGVTFLPGVPLAFAINDMQGRICVVPKSENTPSYFAIRCYTLQEDQTFKPSIGSSAQQHESVNPSDNPPYSWAVDNKAMLDSELLSFLVLAKINSENGATTDPATSASAAISHPYLVTAAISASAAAVIAVLGLGTFKVVKHCKAKREARYVQLPRLDDEGVEL